MLVLDSSRDVEGFDFLHLHFFFAYFLAVFWNKFAERRIVNQKKRIGELRSELIGANAELEEAKRDRERTEQELRGYEVELSMNEASLQALEVCD